MECAERRSSIGNGQTTFVIRGMKDTCIVENEIEKALMTAKRTLEQDNMVWRFGNGAAIYQTPCQSPQAVSIEKSGLVRKTRDMQRLTQQTCTTMEQWKNMLSQA